MKKKKEEKQINKFYYFLKGILMGLFDIVPGISGGTIALITGIYEKLIKEINKFFELIKQITILDKKKIKQKYEDTDFKFLILLATGIAIGIGISVIFMSYLLENYFVQTMSTITGIIIISGLLMMKKIYKNKKQIIPGIIGLSAGIIISIITPLAGHTFTYPQIFFLGAIGIMAMILPGISGALILLLLGGYEFMIHALRNITTEYLFVIAFAIGALLGLFAFSKTIKYLLEKHKEKTMMFLALLMIGATTKPILEIAQTNNINAGLPFFVIATTITYIILRKK